MQLATGGLSLKSFEVPPYLKLRSKIFGKESENVEHSGWGNKIWTGGGGQAVLCEEAAPDKIGLERSFSCVRELAAAKRWAP